MSIPKSKGRASLFDCTLVWRETVSNVCLSRLRTRFSSIEFSDTRRPKRSSTVSALIKCRPWPKVTSTTRFSMGTRSTAAAELMRPKAFLSTCPSKNRAHRRGRELRACIYSVPNAPSPSFIENDLSPDGDFRSSLTSLSPSLARKIVRLSVPSESSPVFCLRAMPSPSLSHRKATLLCSLLLREGRRLNFPQADVANDQWLGVASSRFLS